MIIAEINHNCGLFDHYNYESYSATKSHNMGVICKARPCPRHVHNDIHVNDTHIGSCDTEIVQIQRSVFVYMPVTIVMQLFLFQFLVYLLVLNIETFVAGIRNISQNIFVLRLRYFSTIITIHLIMRFVVCCTKSRHDVSCRV